MRTCNHISAVEVVNTPHDNRFSTMVKAATNLWLYCNKEDEAFKTYTRMKTNPPMPEREMDAMLWFVKLNVGTIYQQTPKDN